MFPLQPLRYHWLISVKLNKQNYLLNYMNQQPMNTPGKRAAIKGRK